MIQANAAVKKGITLKVKVVAATVVFVRACKKLIPAKANRNPARIPNIPVSRIFKKEDRR